MPTLPRKMGIHRPALPRMLMVGAIVLGVSACGQSQSENGTVTGTVLGNGGPPRVTQASPKPELMKKIKVTLTPVNSGTRYQTVTSVNGAFTISVPPGTYQLDSACGRAEPRTVRVSARTRTNRTIECHFG